MSTSNSCSLIVTFISSVDIKLYVSKISRSANASVLPRLPQLYRRSCFTPGADGHCVCRFREIHLISQVPSVKLFSFLCLYFLGGRGRRFRRRLMLRTGFAVRSGSNLSTFRSLITFSHNSILQNNTLKSPVRYSVASLRAPSGPRLQRSTGSSPELRRSPAIFCGLRRPMSSCSV